VSVMNSQKSKDTCLSDIDLLHLEIIEDVRDGSSKFAMRQARQHRHIVGLGTDQ
jgi:hypothetical protein